ncbi:DsbA family oxidoreductase [Ottowia oryzae]|uniref:Disulfide bond formation protein DsbA n=1 Tax=Ottowia oryzae TaxID=2109914 RepID=A0A2S0MHI8_9BURK|nr:DsbA family oxidoreductase [Ottowia oryzae]AVO35339.1 disulfide bond formation protein DsbA [Ottowia oryzae]
MNPNVRIDFVSDIACPWCAIGLASLQQALASTGTAPQVDLHFQPFELNPGMAPEGEDVGEHLARKYGSTAEQQAQIRDTIRQRGAAVGFDFKPEGRGRVVNTFNAHRLLHWAGLQSAQAQLALKQALMQAYHGRGERVDQDDVLLAAVRAAGLDEAAARDVLQGDAYAAEVRADEQRWQQAGIQSVPAIVINGRHLISGGQPPEVFEQALRRAVAGELA